jgi:Holliday junction resolvase
VSRSQRTKGAAFERECVILFNEYHGDAERNLSQSRDGGYDIDSKFGAFECKKRARLPSYLLPAENVRGVAFSSDRGERLMLLRVRDALRLMQMERTVLLKQEEMDREESNRSIATTTERPFGGSSGT